MRVALLYAGRLGAWLSEDGSSDSSNYLGRALAAKEHEVHLFECVRARGSRYRRVEKLHHHTVSINAANGNLHEAIERSTLYYLRCTESVAGLFDVIHCFDSSLIPVAGQMASSGPARAFLSITSEQGASSTSTLAARHRGWSLEEVVDRILVPSNSLKDKLLSEFRFKDGKVVVLRPGVDMQKYSRWVDQGKVKQRYQIGPLDPVSLFVGELCHGCGADTLLEAAFALRREFNAFGVIFAGDGPMLPYLRERARVLGIEGDVRFLGFLSEDQLIDLYNGSNLVFVPGEDSYADKTLLEAWSAGKPTIVSREALPEFVENGSDVLAVEDNSHSICEAIRSILANPVRAKTMGDRAWRKVSAEFSWSAIADKTLDMYQNAISRRTFS